MARLTLILVLAVLVGCSTPETARRVTPEISLPPMRVFGPATPTPTRKSNDVIARDYLDLVFELESGTPLPRLTRFEGPITIKFTGPAPEIAQRDLERLLDRLRREARLPIRQVGGDAPASINLVPVKRSQIQRVAPTAACFVRPNVASWKEFTASRNDPRNSWVNLVVRDKMAIFLPNDVSPQEMRDCLHEEIAQALGPANDIYRLNDSVFNDDNFHTVLTGFDMLILRVHYSSALQNGMTKNEVAARLPRILNRLNPRGFSNRIATPDPIDVRWKGAILVATSPKQSKSRRRAAAKQAVKLAEKLGSNDSRLAFSNYVLGRVSLGDDPIAALKGFLTAGKIYRSREDTAIQEAHVALQIAAFQLSADQADDALRIVDRSLNAVRQAEHAALLSLMLLVKAEALAVLGRLDQSAKVQQEALAWARYGFGDEGEIRARADEIVAISPRANQGGPV